MQHPLIEYSFETRFRPPDYNLRALLDAEDDESSSAPEIGCDDALMDFLERVEREDLPNSIEAPEIVDLFRFLRSFSGTILDVAAFA